MQRVIITGADGFVGSNTVNYFLLQGKEVLALDIGRSSKRLKAHPLLKYVQCDISNVDNLKKVVKSDYYDVFIHFAWAGSAGVERVDYNMQMQNALNTVECLKVAKELGCTKFLGAGSIMEYEVESAVHSQGNKLGMGYIYGMGKYIAHCLCKAVASDIGIDLIWPMITNAYGVGELSPRFINTTLRKIINGEPLQFTAATQNYDFVYITDVATAFYLIAQNGKPFCEYMIGSGNARPLKEFILEMQKEFAPDNIPLFGDIPFTGTNISLDVFNANRIEQDCGYKAKVSFKEGTRMTLEWLKSI